MACGRNRGYSVPVTYPGNWDRNERQGRGCGTCNSCGFDWLAAMQASAQANCEQNEHYMPIDGWNGRERYLMDVLGIMMALLHHRHHE